MLSDYGQEYGSENGRSLIFPEKTEKSQVLSSFKRDMDGNDDEDRFQHDLERRRSEFMRGFIPPDSESDLLIPPRWRVRKRGRNRRKLKDSRSRKKPDPEGVVPRLLVDKIRIHYDESN